MDREIKAVKNAILYSGLDDWVHIAEVASAARQAMSRVTLEEGRVDGSVAGVDELAGRRDEWLARNEREALPVGIAAVKELLRDGFIRIGETSADGFVPWSGSVEEIESRIDTVVRAAEFPLLPGHLFWIENTSTGDEVARSSRGVSR
jgi:hypothetical protein